MKMFPRNFLPTNAVAGDAFRFRAVSILPLLPV